MNLAKYNINTQEYFRQLLPWFMIKNIDDTPKVKAILFYDAISTSLNNIRDAFVSEMTAHKANLKYTNIHKSLEEFLNVTFDPSGLSIRIIENTTNISTSSTWYAYSDNRDNGEVWYTEEESPTGITWGSYEDSIEVVANFTVSIPINLSVNIQDVTNLVNKYKSATKTYNIIRV